MALTITLYLSFIKASKILGLGNKDINICVCVCVCVADSLGCTVETNTTL